MLIITVISFNFIAVITPFSLLIIALIIPIISPGPNYFTCFHPIFLTLQIIDIFDIIKFLIKKYKFQNLPDQFNRFITGLIDLSFF